MKMREEEQRKETGRKWQEMVENEKKGRAIGKRKQQRGLEGKGKERKEE